jgi:hypothetical protein
MVAGISTLAVVTARVAAFLIKDGAENDNLKDST